MMHSTAANRPALHATEEVIFSKGHGTGNDFVLLSDPRGELDLTAERVAAWCSRSTGIGGDGLIRAIRTEFVHEAVDFLAAEPRAEWFMDYRNGDGSIAEMCGNGVRVFVHFLRLEGLVDLEPGGEIIVATRAGLKTVVCVNSQSVDPSVEAAPEAPLGLGAEAHYAVDLGPWSLAQSQLAEERGSDCLVHAEGLNVDRPALSVDMGNPHTVVALAHDEELDGVLLHTQPEISPAPAAGSNVEFVVPVEHGIHDGIGEVKMRVFERGVGETQSCGTGAAAAAAAVRFWAGETAPRHWLVTIPGGRLRVSFQPDADGREHAVLAGPAAVIARGTAVL